MVTAGDRGELRPAAGHPQRPGRPELGWDEDTDDDIRADVEDARASCSMRTPTRSSTCAAVVARR